MDTKLLPSHHRWHPWRTLREQYPHLRVVTTRHLPAGRHGHHDGRYIWICAGLTQVQRRCALTHELIHVERGIFPADAAEEALVERLTALRMITFEELLSAFRWDRHPDPAEMAEELWVTIDVLDTRMRHLDPIEVADLEYQLGGDWSYARAEPRHESA